MGQSVMAELNMSIIDFISAASSGDALGFTRHFVDMDCVGVC